MKIKIWAHKVLPMVEFDVYQNIVTQMWIAEVCQNTANFLASMYKGVASGDGGYDDTVTLSSPLTEEQKKLIQRVYPFVSFRD